MQNKVLKIQFTRLDYFVFELKNDYFIRISAITNAPKMTDAIPFVVKNAKLILLKSSALTKLCW